MEWIGVDLDRTLAYFDVWQGPEHIGAPIPAMLERVKLWLAEGRDVRIFTARVASTHSALERTMASVAIADWCREHLGRALLITCEKDRWMVELWDDRCVQVEPNTGRRVDGKE
jgi:hypothetical protein